MPDEEPSDAAEETPEEADVEAEMLRMMQDEIEGGGDEEGAEGATEAAEAVEEGGAEPAEDVDEMLEQEMLRAMEAGTDEHGGAVAPFMSQLPGLPEDLDEIERLSDIDITVTVEIGGNIIPIKDILAWSKDSVVQLEPEEHEPVDVLVNGRLFARGEVVVVGDTFGVRITELLEAPEEPMM